MSEVRYREFLKKKEIVSTPCGIEPKELSAKLFDFQRDIVRWALRRGRAAIFADCGMGKTPMQLEWARHIPGKVLILAPLAVAEQTVREGKKFGIEVKYQRHGSDGEKITVTNYEMMQNFNVDDYEGIVLDESSILKAQDGKTRTAIIDAFSKTNYRLACTATPAPNDYMELGNHAEFLGIMTVQEMLSMFFVHDGGETEKWRLKGHAQSVFWKWMASWSVMVKKPSDLGYDDKKFILPALNLQEHIVRSTVSSEFLFPMPASTLQERIRVRRDSTEDRVSELVKIVKRTSGQWLIWCNLNTESQKITAAIKNAIEVTGSYTPEFKAQSIVDFADGKIRVLISKPSIIGFGVNLQNCHNVAFLGLSDSYEQFYQAVRRCWRFGQKLPVDCHIVIADTEGAVLANIKRKETDAERMAQNMVEHMKNLTKSEIKGAERSVADYKTDKVCGDSWTLLLGDCVESSKAIPSDSIHYTIFSPPFASLYTYSNSPRDMGNCKTHGEFYEHFKFLVNELKRVTMPGRLVSFHCMNLPTSKQNHGYIGITDFRGDLIRMFQDAGFIYHSEVCIWKDPVTAMQRTKAIGLLHKQLVKDSALSRQGIPDYLVTMRKPGENPQSIKGPLEDYVGDDKTLTQTRDKWNRDEMRDSINIWQRYASPVWMDIDPSDTITFREARENQDERHICPLQLQVIDRGIELWSNPGDTIFSPFAGVGSEGYVAIRKGRKFLGVELKQSYFDQAVKNLKAAKAQEMLLV